MKTTDSTQVTYTQVYNDFKSALGGAADALKTGIEHVYQVMVRQQIIDSITWIIVYVLLGVICFISWKKVNSYVTKEKLKKNNEYHSYGSDDWYLVPVLITIFCVAMFCLSINDVVTGFLNPEYGAMQEIKSFIK
jgi:hypothetical protein